MADQQVIPLSTCGACAQTDDAPKHQIMVGLNNQHTNGELFHPHDFAREGVIHYHFDCPTEWHALVASDLATITRHASIIAKARSGVHGDDLRQWIIESHAVSTPGPDAGVTMMAGGIDQTLANAILDGLGPNTGTTTVGVKTITGPIHMRLFTVNGTDTATGTELTTSGGYTAGGASIAFASSSAGSKATNASVSWTNMPSTTLTGMEEWDTSGTPIRIFWAPWGAGSIVVASGNTFTVSSGALTNSLA